MGDCRKILPTLEAGSVHCCVTSPPYFGLRDYGVEGQIGLEPTPDDYVAELVSVFREVRRVLRDDGTLWLNLGDSYAGGGRGGGSQGSKQQTNVGSLIMTAQHSRSAKPWRRRRAATPRRSQKLCIQRSEVPRGLKPKDLVGIPWRVAFALQADGWWLRSHIIWHKPNPIPESVADRPTSAHESIFLLAKAERYYFDSDAVKEPDVAGHKSGNGYARVDTKNVGGRLSYGGRGQEERWEPGGGRNIRNVWTIPTKPFSEAHFATFPPDLIKPCILAGCPMGGTVMDPFGGAGTTGLVADREGRNAILIELNPEYAGMSRKRIIDDAPLFAEVEDRCPLLPRSTTLSGSKRR